MKRVGTHLGTYVGLVVQVAEENPFKKLETNTGTKAPKWKFLVLLNFGVIPLDEGCGKDLQLQLSKPLT
jgi:hypothetical protein